MCGPERRLDLSLPPIPQRNRHAQTGTDRLVPCFTMIAPLHGKVGNPGFPFLREALFGLFTKPAQPSHGRVPFDRHGCQAVEVEFMAE